MRFAETFFERPSRWSLASEAGAVAIAAAALSILWTLALGPDINYDFLAYHLYLGMHAGGDTLTGNYFPAGVSSYLLPYAHWPLSAMIAAAWPAKLVGAVWSTLQSTAALATWLVAYALFPARTVGDALLRILGTILGILSPLALAAIGSSHVDLITAIPVVVGLAIVLIRLDRVDAGFGWMLLAGACFGAATALKLTNATMALAAGAMMVSICVLRRDVGFATVLAFSLGGIAGAVLTYGYWGWLLWREFANPMFPFLDSLFVPTAGSGATSATVSLIDRLWTFRDGLHQRFLPHGWTEWLLRPLYMIDPMPNAYVEVRAPDARFLALFLLAPIALLMRRGKESSPRHATALGALLTFLAFGWLSWMLLFGNGRYMLPLALASGPALIECLRRVFRHRPGPALTAIAVLMGVQVILVMEGRFRFGESEWLPHWVEASLPPSALSRPATFVVFNGIPASWLTLFVHPASRFVYPDAMSSRTRIADRMPRLLAAGDPLIAVFTYGSIDRESGRPVPATPRAHAPTAARFGVIVDYDACETGQLSHHHPDAMLIGTEGADGRISRRRMVSGYFFCPARYDLSVAGHEPDPVVEAAFDNLERACPGEMPPGTSETMCTTDACYRRYATTDAFVSIDRGGSATVLRFGGFDRPFLGKAADLARSASGVDCRSDLGRYTPFDPGGNVLSRPAGPPPAEPSSADK